MRPVRPDTDDTVRVPRAQARHRLRFALTACLLLVLAGAAAVWLSRPPPPTETVSPAGAPAAAQAAAIPITTATEAEIRRNATAAFTVFRLADNPRILVLDFASLYDQGRMLNRVAAFVEKSGMPHERVLSDAELDAAIRAQGDTVETFYLGHDYAASSLARFFALADRQHIELDPLEETLRALLRQENLLAPGAAAGVISLPAAGSHPKVTEAVRAAILHHELAHGEFFSSPAYADYVRRFWLNEMTGEERGAVRGFLGKDSYDVREEELMYNEMQAYLMFTRDPAFFQPDLAGLTPDRLARLQARFLAGMPPGWLRDRLAADLGSR